MRVDDDAQPIQSHGKEVERLDKFQPLVHHSGGIHADLCAHVPIGMRHGLFGRCRIQFGHGLGAERPAAGRQRNPAHVLQLSPFEALKDGVVFGIDRQQGGAVLLDKARHHLARRNQRLLVRKRDGVALLYRAHGGRKPRATDDGRDGDIGRPRRRIAQRLRAASRFYGCTGKVLTEFGQAAFVAHNRQFCTEFDSQLCQLLRRAIGSQRNDIPLAAIIANKIERGIADGAGRAEEGDRAGHKIGNTTKLPTTITTGISPSIRSNTPPWPGMRFDESFIAAFRLSQLSKKSPA